MKTKIILFQLIIGYALLILISCSDEAGLVMHSTIQDDIKIRSGDLLVVSLGQFGDEEGAWVLKEPEHADVSKVVHAHSTSSFYYDYMPVYEFAGTDTVILILNRESDGSIHAVNDTVDIRIDVVR